MPRIVRIQNREIHISSNSGPLDPTPVIKKLKDVLCSQRALRIETDNWDPSELKDLAEANFYHVGALPMMIERAKGIHPRDCLPVYFFGLNGSVRDRVQEQDPQNHWANENSKGDVTHYFAFGLLGEGIPAVAQIREKEQGAKPKQLAHPPQYRILSAVRVGEEQKPIAPPVKPKITTPVRETPKQKHQPKKAKPSQSKTSEPPDPNVKAILDLLGYKTLRQAISSVSYATLEPDERRAVIQWMAENRNATGLLKKLLDKLRLNRDIDPR